MGDKLAPTTRHAYTHEGRVVYEWDQTLDECNFYVRTPPGVKAKILDVEVTSTSVWVEICLSAAGAVHYVVLIQGCSPPSPEQAPRC